MKTRRTTSPALCAVIGLLFLSGCSSLSHNPDRPAALFLNTYGIEPPTTPRDFTTCYHYGCDGGGGEVHLSALEWQQVRNLFLPPATDAGEEREHIAVAIAMLEETIGRQNNTFADQACNNFRAPVESYQHDCVAETVNSTIYLLLMEGN